MNVYREAVVKSSRASALDSSSGFLSQTGSQSYSFSLVFVLTLCLMGDFFVPAPSFAQETKGALHPQPKRRAHSLKGVPMSGKTVHSVRVRGAEGTGKRTDSLKADAQKTPVVTTALHSTGYPVKLSVSPKPVKRTTASVVSHPYAFTGGAMATTPTRFPSESAPSGFVSTPLRVGQVATHIMESGDTEAADSSLNAQTSSTPLPIVSNSDELSLANSIIRPQIAAQPKYKPEFELPRSLRSQELDTRVTIRVRVEADGSHVETLLTGSGIAELDAYVLLHLKRWRWEPAQQDGKPAASFFRMTLPIKTE